MPAPPPTTLFSLHFSSPRKALLELWLLLGKLIDGWRSAFRLAVALLAATLLSACLLSFHPFDPTPLNLRTPLGGTQNLFGTPGALLAGALMETFGAATLLLPLIVFSRICFPHKDFSSIRYWLTALLMLTSLASLLGLLGIPPIAGITGSGWIGWSAQRWAQYTLGNWIGITPVIFACVWLITKLNPCWPSAFPQKLKRFCFFPIATVYSLLFYLRILLHKFVPHTLKQLFKGNSKSTTKYPQKTPLPTITPQTPVSNPPTPPEAPPASSSKTTSVGVFHKDWQQRCDSWQENLELDWTTPPSPPKN